MLLSATRPPAPLLLRYPPRRSERSDAERAEQSRDEGAGDTERCVERRDVAREQRRKGGALRAARRAPHAQRGAASGVVHSDVERRCATSCGATQRAPLDVEHAKVLAYEVLRRSRAQRRAARRQAVRREAPPHRTAHEAWDAAVHAAVSEAGGGHFDDSVAGNRKLLRAAPRAGRVAPAVAWPRHRELRDVHVAGEQNEAARRVFAQQRKEPSTLRGKVPPALHHGIRRQHLDRGDDDVHRGGGLGELALEPQPLGLAEDCADVLFRPPEPRRQPARRRGEHWSELPHQRAAEQRTDGGQHVRLAVEACIERDDLHPPPLRSVHVGCVHPVAPPPRRRFRHPKKVVEEHGALRTVNYTVRHETSATARIVHAVVVVVVRANHGRSSAQTPLHAHVRRARVHRGVRSAQRVERR